MKRIATFITLLAMLLSLSVPALASEARAEAMLQTAQIDSIASTLFTAGDITIVEENNDVVNNLTFSANKHLATLSFFSPTFQTSLDFTVELKQLDNITGNGHEWLGIPELEDSEFRILCFRLEESANGITLLKPNAMFAGHDVLSIAIQQVETGDIIYFQIPLDRYGFDIDGIASENTDDAEFYEDVRSNYCQLKGYANVTNTYSDVALMSASSSMEGDLSSYIASLPTYTSEPSAISPHGVITNIDDGIFKSGNFDEVRYGNATAGAQFYYLVAHNFAGTGNRENHIMVFEWVRNRIASQDYVSQIRVTQNACVHYNVSSGELILAVTHHNPSYVSNASTAIAVGNAASGIIIKRQQYASISDSTYKKIAKCIITWYSHASQVIETYTTLTGSAANDIQAYQPTRALQISVYGETVGGVDVTTDRMRLVGDYIYLEVWGDGITSVLYTKSMSFSG